MQQLLLTGGLGYIGQKFQEKFQNKYVFHLIDTGYFKLPDLINIENTNFVDIRKIKKEDLINIDYIVHMGELSNDPLGNLNPNITYDINHKGTVNLLNLANKSNIKKLIYMSSASVYGYSGKVSHEDSEVNPLTQYSKAKYKNENYILGKRFNFETIILRNSTAFGFSRNLRLDLVVNDLTYSAFRNNKIDLLSDGSPKRPLVHIDDISNLIDIILSDDRNLDKQIFNVGSHSLNFSIREIAEIISEVLSINNITFGKHDSDQRSYFLNFDKLSNYFPDYKLEFDLQKGVLDLYNNLESYIINGNEKRLDKINFLIKEKKLNKNLYWS